MKLNCKPGDLAVIVRSLHRPNCLGKVVKCVRFDPGPKGEPAWRIDRAVGPVLMVDGIGRRGDWWYDKCLRPIRDNDGEDETLQWAPRKVEA